MRRADDWICGAEDVIFHAEYSICRATNSICRATNSTVPVSPLNPTRSGMLNPPDKSHLSRVKFNLSRGRWNPTRVSRKDPGLKRRLPPVRFHLSRLRFNHPHGRLNLTPVSSSFPRVKSGFLPPYI